MSARLLIVRPSLLGPPFSSACCCRGRRAHLPSLRAGKPSRAPVLAYSSAPGISSSSSSPPHPFSLKRAAGVALIRLAAALFLPLFLYFFSFVNPSRAAALQANSQEPTVVTAASEDGMDADGDEDVEWKAAFEKFKSKTYALSVPLRVVALRASIHPSWIKEFIQAQGRRVRFSPEFRTTLDSIFFELSSSSNKGQIQPKSLMAADVVTMGDSWLSYAITRGLIEPIRNPEEQDWYRNLSDKWKFYLRRNIRGEIDSTGSLWAVPYRWGTMVIAYKTNKFAKHDLNPIVDWEDLWRPELAGRISMIDSPREVVGAALKRLGASYNCRDIESQVQGGRKSVLECLIALQRQVRLFDSTQYMKSFGVGDTWVAVGWSSDVIPAAKRMRNVAVVVPKSGSSIWADIWAIPNATRLKTDRIGSRVRSPSPLVHQWFEFCLQPARSLSFLQEVLTGASPLYIDQEASGRPQDPSNGKPKLDGNLIDGMPPQEILDRSEFLEPLSDKASADYEWLISCLKRTRTEQREKLFSE